MLHMKILFLLPSLALGGAERQAILLARHLQGAGHNIVVAGFGEEGAASELCRQNGIACKPRPFPLASWSVVGKCIATARLWWALAMEKPDVILSYCMAPNVFSSYLWHFTSAKACFWGQRDEGRSADYLHIFPKALDLCSGFISNSAAGVQFLTRCGIPESRIHHIPNAVQLPLPRLSRREWRAKLNISDSAQMVTMVANLSQYKEHDLLLHAWNLYRRNDQPGREAKLVLVGRFDERTNYLRALAQRLEITETVIFAGAMDDVSGILAASDCAVFASLREGLPNGVLEAMDAALPVIALDILGTREALGEGGKNFLVTEKTSRALADTLGNLLSDPQRCEVAGRANHERVRTIFSPSTMFASYDRLLTTLPACPSRRLYALKGLGIALLHTLPRKIKNLMRPARTIARRSCLVVENIAARWAFRKKARQDRVMKSLADTQIGIAVLVHNRPDELKPCLDSLFTSDYSNLNITFLLHDDGSDDPRVRDLVEEPRAESLRIHRYYKNKCSNSWGAAFNSAMRKLSSLGNFDILICCDSDALFHPQWLQKTLPLFLWAKRKHKFHKLGPFSPFNSSDKDFHKILGSFESPYGQYWVKEQMGALVYCWTREDFERWGGFEECREDETLKTKQFRAQKIRNFCSSTSYVEHLGQDSVLNRWRPTPVSRAVYGLNLTSESGWPQALQQAGTLGYYRDVLGLPPVGQTSKVTLDIFIPAVAKDSKVLPLAIQGIQRNLGHPCGGIVVATPSHCLTRLREAVAGLGVQVVDEQEFLPCARESIVYAPCGNDRSGWLVQQLLKFNAAAHCRHDHCLVVDADTVLLRSQVFERNERSVLQIADEFHVPYYDVFQRIFGYPTASFISCVTHMMCFSKKNINEMLAEIELRWGVAWYDAIQLAADKFTTSGFSEYETYGHWLQRNKPEMISLEYFFNMAAPKSLLANNEQLEKNYGDHMCSISFQSYI